MPEMRTRACNAVIDDQNEITAKVLAQCQGRSKLKSLISTIMDHPKRGIPWKRGDRCALASCHISGNRLDVCSACCTPCSCVC